MQKFKVAITTLGMLLFLSIVSNAYGADEIVLYNGYERFDSDLNFCEQTKDISGSGWQWKAANKQLILNGAKINGTNSGLVLPDNTEIVLIDGTQNTLIEREGLFTKSAVYCNGDLKISGNGQWDIYSDGYGISTDGECLIDSGNINIVSFWSGIDVKSYVQNGGAVYLNELDDADEAMYAESLQMNKGELDVESNAGGISSQEMTMNDGVISIAAIGSGIEIMEGDCLINDGIIKIKGNNECGVFRGLSLYEGSRFIMHDGELEITAIQCDDKASATNYALGGIIHENEINKQKVWIDGGQLKITGSYAMKFEIGKEEAKKIEGIDSLALEKVIHIDSKLMVIDGLQIGGVKQLGYNIKGELWESYFYGLIKEGELVSNAFLSAGQADARPAGPDGFCVDGGKITLTTTNVGSIYIDENGRTIVPLRTLTEAMGCIVKWNEADQGITVADGKGASTAVFYLNQKTYRVYGEERLMDTTAIFLSPGCTHVPLRFVAESLGLRCVSRNEQ